MRLVTETSLARLEGKKGRVRKYVQEPDEERSSSMQQLQPWTHERMQVTCANRSILSPLALNGVASLFVLRRCPSILSSLLPSFQLVFPIPFPVSYAFFPSPIPRFVRWPGATPKPNESAPALTNRDARATSKKRCEYFGGSATTNGLLRSVPHIAKEDGKREWREGARWCGATITNITMTKQHGLG